MRRRDLHALIDHRPEQGISRVHRSVFSSQALFDLEMRHLFEGGWVFLALESQLPRPHDFLVVPMGRQSILLARDGDGQVGAFYNTCPHRGARICSLEAGNNRIHVCPYHSWSFDSAGRNRAIKSKSTGEYTAEFLAENHDLHRIARLDSYRGFLFGSLSDGVGSLEDYLGDARTGLDMLVDQSEEGLEIVPGGVTYTYRANWKQQLENCSDAYHVTSVHPTYIRAAEQRAREGTTGSGTEGTWARLSTITEEHAAGSRAGTLSFANGHVLLWSATAPLPGHPLYEQRAALEQRVGAVRRDWMFYTRNLTIFPNVQFADNFSSQLRIMRPIAPDFTEMKTYCLAPRGENAEARRLRLRQYEDFFNPTGMATPDDNSVYEDCQEGHWIAGEPGWLQGYARGMTLSRAGGGEAAQAIGVKPRHSVEGSTQVFDETVLGGYYRAWAERIGPVMAELGQEGAV